MLKRDESFKSVKNKIIRQGPKLIFRNLKLETNLYFPLSFSNSRSLHKSIRIFPLGTPHKLQRIVIKRCHDFNVYTKLHSRVIRRNRIFSKKEHVNISYEVLSKAAIESCSAK